MTFFSLGSDYSRALWPIKHMTLLYWVPGRDPEQLSDWLSGRHKPFCRNLEKIELFLSDHLQGPGADQFARTEVPEESAETKGSMKSFMAKTTSEKSSGT